MDPDEPDDHALGRSRGGSGPKNHILCDGARIPLHFHLTPGQLHEGRALDTVLIGADETLEEQHGTLMAWPLALAGDKGYPYRADWIDRYSLGLGIKPVIPSKQNEDRRLRPVAFNKAVYRRRCIVECLIGCLKEARRIATRFEKTAIHLAR